MIGLSTELVTKGTCKLATVEEFSRVLSEEKNLFSFECNDSLFVSESLEEF